ncbi:MAG: right-handed parallel beta-helix repeat-containing protein, partial [bacterium]
MSKKIMLGILVVLGMLVGMGSLSMVNATTYYVDAVNGNDDNPGTQEEPFKTIGKGVEVAIDGDTVQCAPGTYTEEITITERIALVGNGTPTIDPDIDGTAVTFSGNGADDASISGFRITGVTGDWGVAGIHCYDADPKITNNIITDNIFRGIRCSDSSPSITNNTIIRNGEISIECGPYSHSSITNNIIRGNTWGINCHYYSNPIITNNIITDNEYDGVSCDYSSPTITNNTIMGNDGVGIYCYNSSSPITNNIITSNGIGIQSSESSPIIDYNCVWGNSYADYYDCVAGDNDISEPPQFVNEANGDYHLRPTSPCIDVGSNTAPALP